MTTTTLSPSATAPAPLMLPTVEEVADVLRSGDGRCFYSDSAREILDLIADRVPVWQPVQPGAVIKSGTRVREDWDDQITEWTLGEELIMEPQRRYWFDPRTIPAPEDPRVEVLAEEMEAEWPHCDDEWPCAGAERFRGAARRAIARLDALGGEGK